MRVLNRIVSSTFIRYLWLFILYSSDSKSKHFFVFLADSTRINSVRFSARDDPQGIFLALCPSNGGALQYWELSEEERTIHSLFSSTDVSSRIPRWQCLSAFNTTNPITNICPTRNSWIYGLESNNSCQHLVITTTNGDLISLQKDTLKQVRCMCCVTSCKKWNAKTIFCNIKKKYIHKVGQLHLWEKLKYDLSSHGSISCLSLTAMGNALVAFDQKSTMIICKLPPISDLGIVIYIRFFVFY